MSPPAFTEENRALAFSERVRIPAGDIVLDGRLTYPPEAASAEAVVLLSPHPNFAGTMDNNVIAALDDTLSGAGFVTLRFNYPGIGGSGIRLPAEITSTFDFWEWVERTQRFEAALAPSLAAVGFLRQNLGDRLRRLHLVGYSYGGAIAMRMAPQALPVETVAAISMPWVSRYDYAFLARAVGRKLFVNGTRDFAFEEDVFERVWPQVPEPKRFERVADDHFFRKNEVPLARRVLGFIESDAV